MEEEKKFKKISERQREKERKTKKYPEFSEW